MRTINLYVELDGLYDMRRTIIESLMVPEASWDKDFRKTYENRRLDFFDKPETGVTHARFKEAYAARNIQSLARTLYPTHLLNRMLTMILDVDQMIGKPIDIGTVGMFVNLHPYDLSDDLKKELEDAILLALPYNVDVTFVSVTPDQLTAKYFMPFTHVFKYDLLAESNQAFAQSLGDVMIKDVKFFIPNLFVKEPEKDFLAEPEEVIMKMSVVLAPALTIISKPHQIYDYR